MMQINIAAAISIDGKLTRHDETSIYDWISKEDQVHFRQLISEHEVIVMGSGSYEAVKDRLNLESNRLRVVITSRPEEYKRYEIKNKLEFYQGTIKELAERLEEKGFKKVLVVGGPKMITEFLNAELIDNIYLTIEPRLFGQGKPLLESLPVDISVKLQEQRVLNSQGTLLLKYKVR